MSDPLPKAEFQPQLTGRVGERSSRWRRSTRTFSGSEGWHVKTREGHPLGPYLTEFDANLVAALLIAQLQQATSPEACRRIIYNFRHDDRFRIAGRLDRSGNQAAS